MVENKMILTLTGIQSYDLAHESNLLAHGHDCHCHIINLFCLNITLTAQ